MPGIFDLSKPTKCQGSGEWFFQDENGVELIVSGSEASPDAEKMAAAETLVGDLAAAQGRAIQFLKEFIKDSGTWSLDEINFGSNAGEQKCDFLLGFGFEQDGHPYEYQYCSFSVCFMQQTPLSPPHNKPRPFNLVLEVR